MDDVNNNFYLFLSKNPIRFEPVSSVTSVFFDESNRQVFTVRANGAAGIVVKGPDERINITLRIEDRGELMSIKFSSDMKILAIQRSPKAVDFINIMCGGDISEYSQTCKGKTTKILGFCWVGIYEIVYVTDHGIEHYQIIPEKKTLKLLKTFSLTINWFVWVTESSACLVSSGTLGNTLYPFLFKHGTANKLPKFEVELLSVPKPPQLSLKQRDVLLANIYGRLFLILVRHQIPNARGSLMAEIILYQILRDGMIKKTNVLKLDMSGRFALSIVDNLVIVHHQASKTSLMFDIHLPGETENGVTYHPSVLSPLPIRPFKLILPAVPTSSGADVQEYNCDLYSPNWVIFPPDVILDAKLGGWRLLQHMIIVFKMLGVTQIAEWAFGCFWYLKLNLESIVTMITDKCCLVDFLLLRQDSKPVLLNVCKNMLVPGKQANLTTISTIFNKFNRVYAVHLESEREAQIADVNGTSRLDIARKTPVIDQSDMFTHVFSVFDEQKDIGYKFVVAVLMEYFRSLGLFQIPVQHYLYELIINTLVQHNSFYQLHQFLQYHVIGDSKPLACLLLSLESSYPPAHQLALDMLKRLSTANEAIVEVLLNKKQLLTAIRFVQSVGAVEQVQARKFLEVAKEADNKMHFYTVFRFFEQRNVRLRGNPKFVPGEHCDQYVEHFKQEFGAEALLPS